MGGIHCWHVQSYRMLLAPWSILPTRKSHLSPRLMLARMLYPYTEGDSHSTEVGPIGCAKHNSPKPCMILALGHKMNSETREHATQISFIKRGGDWPSFASRPFDNQISGRAMLPGLSLIMKYNENEKPVGRPSNASRPHI